MANPSKSNATITFQFQTVVLQRQISTDSARTIGKAEVIVEARFGESIPPSRLAIRHQWLRDFPKTLDRSGIRSTLGRLPIKSSGACVLDCSALRGSNRFTPTVSIRQKQVREI